MGVFKNTGVFAFFFALLIAGCDFNITTTSTVKPATVDIIAPTITKFVVPATSNSLVVSGIQLTADDNFGVGGYALSDSNVVPLVSSGSFSSAPPTSFTFTSPGQKTLYAFVVDNSGNVSKPMSANINISLASDTTKPVMTAFTMPATASSLSVPILSLTATDNVGVAGFFVSESSAVPSATASGWSATAPSTYTFASAGQKTLYAFAKDLNGNVSASSRSASVNIALASDTAAPVVNTFTLPATASSLSVCGISGAATDNVGVVGFALSESAGATSFSATVPACFTFASAGTRTLYLLAKDAAGNIGNKSAQIVITLPSTVTLAPSGDTYISDEVLHASEATLNTYTWKDYVSANAILMKFDLSALPANAVIDSAALNLYLVSTDGVQALYRETIHAIVNKPMDPSKATGSTYDGVNAWSPVSNRTTPMGLGDISAPYATMDLDITLGVKTVEVKDLIQYWINNPALNYGLLINSDTSVVQDRFRSFASMEAATVSQRPSMTIAYHLGTPVADSSAPIISSFTIPSTSSSTTVPITAFTATDNVKVTGYMVSESSTKPAPGNSGFVTVAPSSYTFSGTGAKTLYAFAKDAAGNVSSAASASVNISTVAQSAILGMNTVGSKQDSGTAGALTFNKFVMGPNNGNATSMSVYVGPVDSNPANTKFQMAVYADNGGKPGALIASTSAAQSLVAGSWNTLPISASLAAGTTYWLAYTNNGSAATVNNTYYADTTDTTQQFWMSLPNFGTMPSQFVDSPENSGAFLTSIYLTYTVGSLGTTGSATVSWTAPTSYTDGSAISANDLTGYKILYGTVSGNYSNTVNVSGGGTLSYTISNLPGGKTYYFVVVAVSASGGDSAYSSPVISKTIP